MKNKVLLVLCFILFCSHDMYLKMDTYFIKPNSNAVINLYNGTFENSENTINRNRMLDASLVGNGNRIQVAEDQWSEKDSVTVLQFTSGNPGTWVAGVSTRPRNIAMKAKDFNNYLAHDGVKDVLTSRKENNVLDQDAIEKYSKHVKAIFQVGDTTSDDWKTILGYPIEFVPLSNPYEMHTGDTLSVKLLRDGKPLANQLVYADYRPSVYGHSHNQSSKTHTHGSEETHSHVADQTHTHDGTTHTHANEEKEDHQHTSGQELRTDEQGVLSMTLSDDGIWFLRTIHLVPSELEGLTHESNWATLTFEVAHDHEDDPQDAHAHDDESGIPSYVFWIGSILILGGLFFWFNRKG